MFPKHDSLFITSLLALGLCSYATYRYLSSSKKHSRHQNENHPQIQKGILGCIGNTPLIEIPSLSKETGCTILGKCEFLNIGGSVKDRVALKIIQDAERDGLLKPGGTLFEGTVGSTGISLAIVCLAKGYKCHIVMPNDQAREKSELLRQLGATVEEVPPVAIIHSEHFVNLARARATQLNQAGGNGFFSNQFENLSNFQAHLTSTAPEIWEQTNHDLDAIILGSGTGGTIAGLSNYFKDKSNQRNRKILIALADPTGSSLYNRVMYSTLWTKEEAEGSRKRNQVDTIVEGIGLNRLTANFLQAQIDVAFKVTDQEAVNMAYYLLKHEGLFLGSTTAVNCVAAVRLARQLGPGHKIVTILCDSGVRHRTKFYNSEKMKEYNCIDPKLLDQDPLFFQNLNWLK